MNFEYKISEVLRAFEGSLKPGVLKRKAFGRYSDALVYFKCGSVKYIFDEYSFAAKAGNVIFLPKESFYEMHIDEYAEYICIDFEFISTSTARHAVIYRSIPNSIKNDFEKYLYNQYRNEPWYIADNFSYIYRIYSVLLKAKHKTYSESGTKSSNVVKYILEHYTEPTLSIMDIAEKTGVSEPQLRRLLKNKTSMSPVKYISYLRIEKAKSLLKNTNYTIMEISLLCGYTDQYYFSRAFKSHVGIPPSEYKDL